MDTKALSNKSKRKRSPSPVEKKTTNRKRSPSPTTDKKRRRVRSTPNTQTNKKKGNFKQVDEDSQDALKEQEIDSPESTNDHIQSQPTAATNTTTNTSTISNNNTATNQNNENVTTISNNKDSNGDTNDKDDKHNLERDKLNSPNSLDSNVNSPSNTARTNEKTTANNDQDDNVTEQANHIVIPSYSAWFDYNAIHTVERRALPEFFNNENKSKTAEVYLAYRNFMIDTYRLHPTDYLTVTACRRNLAGDVCTIMRVHAFLEQWGLINYQVNEPKPSPMGPPSTSHFHVYIDTPSCLQTGSALKTTTPLTNGNLTTSTSNKENDLKDANSSTNAALTNGSLNKDNFGLKIDQYSKKDEYYKNKAASKASREWTEQETLLLLEAVEMYKDDWNKVCEHVGSRTQDECILQFLRLPIEDPYLEDGELSSKTSNSNKSSQSSTSVLGPLAYQPIPFSRAGNPIMSTVAFLASVVDPRIALAASKTAMEEFAKIKDEVPASILNAHLKHVEQTHSEGKLDLKASLALTGIAGTGSEEKEANNDKASENSATNKKDEQKDQTATNDKMEVDIKKEDDKKQLAIGNGENKKDDKKEKTDEMNTNDKSKEDSNKKEETTVANNAKLDAEVEKLLKEGQVSAAASIALASSAVKAKHLAAIEERKIKSLVALLVETQMRKLETRLRHFDELEAMMDKERETLEYQRQQLIQERQIFYLEQEKHSKVRIKQQALLQYYQTRHGAVSPSNLLNLPQVNQVSGHFEDENLQNCAPQLPQLVPMNNQQQPTAPISSRPQYNNNWPVNQQPPQQLNTQQQRPVQQPPSSQFNNQQPQIAQLPPQQLSSVNSNLTNNKSPLASSQSPLPYNSSSQPPHLNNQQQTPQLRNPNEQHNLVQNQQQPPQMLPPQMQQQKLPPNPYPPTAPQSAMHPSHLNPVNVQQQQVPPPFVPVPNSAGPISGNQLTQVPPPHQVNQVPAPIQAIEQMSQMHNQIVAPQSVVTNDQSPSINVNNSSVNNLQPSPPSSQSNQPPAPSQQQQQQQQTPTNTNVTPTPVTNEHLSSTNENKITINSDQSQTNNTNLTNNSKNGTNNVQQSSSPQPAVTASNPSPVNNSTINQPVLSPSNQSQSQTTPTINTINNSTAEVPNPTGSPSNNVSISEQSSKSDKVQNSNQTQSVQSADASSKA